MDYKEIWKKTNEDLKNSLPAHAFEAWIETLSPVGITNDILIVEAPNQFAYDWIINNYQDIISSSLKEVESTLQLKVSIAPQSEQNISSVELDKEETTKQSNAGKRNNINPSNIFSSFIEGPNNIFAKNAAHKVASAPGSADFNPLIIYGGVGLGKTHLLHSIANELINSKKEMNVVLASSEKFTNDFIASIQENKTLDFSKVYRNADVLLIDDIQFFQGKEQTQEQFFHTFNELYTNGKQIVMTADRYPGEMSGLQDRLLSRFQSGLSVDVQPPNYETRVAILMEKAEMNGLSLPYDVIEFIAIHLKNSVRELESTIIRLLAHASLTQADIDFPLVKKVLKERLGDTISADVSAEDIINRVADLTNVRSDDIVGPSRRKEIAEARQISVYLCRELLGLSLSTIGMHFGGRDHTTALHACNKVRNSLKSDKRFNRIVGKVKDDFSFSIL